MGSLLSMSSLTRSPASSQSCPMAGSTRVPRRRHRWWRRATSGCQTRDRTGAPSPSARGWTTSCTSSACFPTGAHDDDVDAFSQLIARLRQAGVELAGLVADDLLDAGTLRDDSRLLRPAVDGTYEDGERNGLRNDCGCGRPPRRSGLHRGPAVRPPDTVVAMALAYHAFKAGRQPGDDGVTI